MTTLDVPADALVLLVGVAGSGKSTIAARHFPADAVLSSDAYRAAVSGDPSDQSATDEAFDRLRTDLDRRMAAGQLAVVDATNVQGWARRELRAVAAHHGRPVVAIVLALPPELSLERNAARPDRRVPPSAIRRQDRHLKQSLPKLADEGYAAVLMLSDPDQVEALRIRTRRNVPKERHPAL
ncbi:MAG TPA: AAA family ATPase [Candidatus Limnocylindria bacterium]